MLQCLPSLIEIHSLPSLRPASTCITIPMHAVSRAFLWTFLWSCMAITGHGCVLYSCCFLVRPHFSSHPPPCNILRMRSMQEKDDNSSTTNDNQRVVDDKAGTTNMETTVIRMVLDAMKNSPLIDEKHAEHCASPSVTHLFKGTPLVRLPDRLKLDFVNSWAGRTLATIMAEEQNYLGDWKMEKIIEAAGDYDADEVAGRISRDISSNKIVVYSFDDCPWCVATKDLLYDNEAYYDPSWTTVIELEDCGLVGKHIRAELCKMTGRTSMPCIFVGGRPIGGFTDGDPCGPGIKKLHDSGELIELMKI